MKIGVMVNNLEPDRLRAFDVARQLGFDVVHTSALPEAWLVGPKRQEYIDAARASGVHIAAMFVGFDGQSYADIPTIRRTVGLAIRALRPHRLEVSRQYSALAAELGVPALATHLGFFPEEAEDYRDLVLTVRQFAEHCAACQQMLLLETGQESAARLLQFIHDVEHPALGVNFDPANFLLYGVAEPVAALEQLLPYVRGVHCKDGVRANQAGVLGTETPVGQGEVDFPKLLQRLVRSGYSGPLVIERESGDRKREDIIAARAYLQALPRVEGIPNH